MRVKVRNLGGLPGGGEQCPGLAHWGRAFRERQTQMGSCWGAWAAGGATERQVKGISFRGNQGAALVIGNLGSLRGQEKGGGAAGHCSPAWETPITRANPRWNGGS